MISFEDLSGQCSLNGGETSLTLRTQSEINTFAINYSSCSNLKFSININSVQNGDYINDLSSLSFIDSVSGFFSIDNIPYIENVDFLDNLSFVEKSLSFNDWDSLTTITDVNNLKFIGQALGIEDCPKLESIDAFENLEKTGLLLFRELPALTDVKLFSSLSIIDELNLLNTGITDLNFLLKNINVTTNISISNSQILELDAFYNLDTLSNGLVLRANSQLKKITGFQNLNYCNNLEISECINLSSDSIDIFQNLQEVNDIIAIISNYSICDLNFLDNLNITNNIFIRDNPLLKNIEGLTKVSGNILESVRMWNNNSLNDCTTLCPHVQKGREIILMNNLIGCNSEEELLSICGPSNTQIIESNSSLIYPNPTEDFLFVRNYNPDVILDVFSTAGEKIFQSISNEKIDVSALSSGIYILVISIGDKRYIQKLLKL